MPADNSQTRPIPFANRGLVSKLDSHQLQPGQLQNATNINSLQEGTICSRSGSKSWAGLPVAGGLIHTFAKLRISDNDALNIRYFGEGQDIWRCRNWLSGAPLFANTYSGIVSLANAVAKRWTMAAYSAGASGNPWAFFAGETAMVKDRGANPYATLRNWGILPAAGACTCTVGAASSVAVTGATTASPINVTGVAHPFVTGQTVVLAGVTGITEANGTWVVTVTGVDNFTLNGSVGVNAYVAGGTATLAGPDNSIGGSVPYDYIFTHRSDETGNEGNPSTPMIEANYVAAANQPITVTVWGTGDAQISTTGSKTLAIYRRGGLLSDALYRLVGYVSNPGLGGGGVPNSTTFVDRNSDADLVLSNAKTVEFDNDPPVTSSLPTPWEAVLSGVVAVGWGTLQSTAATGIQLTAGSMVSISDGANSEQVVIQAILAADQYRVYYQKPHPYTGTTAKMTCNALVGQPCRLVCSAFDSLFVAGDPNNPHVLYKSKTGRPESFPVIASDGTANSINVGTPSNGIAAITEAGGVIVCMNRSNLFTVSLWRGKMQAPNETFAQRGLYSPFAWAKADNELFYLAYDGIYSWQGGESIKRSEPIDPSFHARTVNGIAPVDLVNASQLQYCSMAYYRNAIIFLYRDTSNVTSLLTYQILYDRWLPELGPQTVTALGLEKDTGQLFFGRYDPAAGAAIIGLYDQEGTIGTTDLFTGPAGNTSSPIAFSFKTAFYDEGDPILRKLWQVVHLEMDNPDPANPVVVKFYYDDAVAADPSDQFTVLGGNVTSATGVSYVVAGTGRRLFPFPLQTNVGGTGSTTFGKEARTMAVQISGSVTNRTTFYSLTPRVTALAQLQIGQNMDWTDLGWKGDKRLYVLQIEYETGGGSVNLHLDIVNGVLGDQPIINAQTFLLQSQPVINSRAQRSFPIQDFVIAKLVRLRTDVGGQNFHIFNWNIVKENYPPDIVPFTEWEDGGTELDKYGQELMIDVDTNNTVVPLQVHADNVLITTFSVQTSTADRRRNLTLPSNSRGRKWRLFVDVNLIPAGGKFQLFDKKFEFQRADKGPVGHTFDWDDLGHPWDKRLETITIEYDNNGAGPFVMTMDTMSGIDGNVQVVGAQLFTLPGLSRGKKTFPIIDAQVVKLVRLYPVSTTPGFKVWGYSFKKDDYPPDTVFFTDYGDLGYEYDKNPRTLSLDVDTANVTALCEVQADGVTVASFNVNTGPATRKVQFKFAPDIRGKLWRLRNTPGVGGKFQLFSWPIEYAKDPADDVPWTEWRDFGYGCEKIGRNLILTVDTGGVQALVDLQADGVSKQVVPITSTYIDRQKVVALNSDLIGKLWRLVPAPGIGGKFKLWDWNLDHIREPCEVLRLDEYEQGFQVEGWKWLKQIWIDYTCLSTVTFTIYRDTGQLFYAVTLPVRSKRDVERFYLPAINAGALNKSKKYRFVMASTGLNGFKLYRDTSRIEFQVCGADQRAAFQQFPLFAGLQLDIGAGIGGTNPA